MGFTGADRRRRFLFSPSRVLAKSAVFWISPGGQSSSSVALAASHATSSGRRDSAFPLVGVFVPGVQDDDDFLPSGKMATGAGGGSGDDRSAVA